MKLSAILAPLIAARVPHEIIMQTVQAWESEQSNALEKRREADRARQAKKRSRHVTSRDVTVTDSSRARVEDSSSKISISGESKKKDASPTAQPRGSRIPDDFQPSIHDAIAEGLLRESAEREARSFTDYWRAKPGKDAVKLDWPATWRNWVRRTLSSQPRTSPPPTRNINDALNDIINGVNPDVSFPGTTIEASYERRDRPSASNLVQFDAPAARSRS